MARTSSSHVGRVESKTPRDKDKVVKRTPGKPSAEHGKSRPLLLLAGPVEIGAGAETGCGEALGPTGGFTFHRREIPGKAHAAAHSLRRPPGRALLDGRRGRAGHRAGAGVRFTAAQLFVKNNKQWFAPPLGGGGGRGLSARHARPRAFVCFAHNSYLINLANQDPAMFETSVKAMIAEVERAEALALPFIVMHPGSHGGAGETAGLARIVEGLDRIIEETAGYRCRLALEITAGQGNALGHRLEHLTYLIEHVADETRCGICLDTAHLFAAGYDIRTREGYESLVSAVEKQTREPGVCWGCI